MYLISTASKFKIHKRKVYNKVKRLAMASDPQSQLSPYVVLGLPENASSGQIHCTYKALIRLVHPDRANHTVNGIGLLKWTKEERESAFGEITKAYRTILEQRKEARDYPDDFVDLTEFDYEARGFSEEFTVPQEFSAFDLESFNSAFKAQNAIDAEHGYSCSLTASLGSDDWSEGNGSDFKPKEESRDASSLALWRGTKLFSETIPSMELVDTGDSCTTKVPLGGKGGAYALVGSDIRDSFQESNSQVLSLESEEKVEPLSSDEIMKRIEEYSNSVLSPSISCDGSCPVLEEAKKIDQNRYREQKKKDEYYRHRKLFIAK